MGESAYLIPYFIDEKNIVHILYGQKQLISYVALSSFNLKNFKPFQEKAFLNAVKTDNVIDEYGKIKSLKCYEKFCTRFYGVLLPAGGKPAFLGGGRDEKSDKDLKETAIREFKEESGLSLEIEKSLLEEVYRIDWKGGGGTYYAVDLMKIKELDWEKEVSNMNNKITTMEKTIDEIGLTQITKNKPEFLTEMHAIKLETPKDFLLFSSSKNYEKFIKSEVEKICSIISNKLKLPIIQQKTFFNQIYKHMLAEPIDGHSEAIQKFISVYSCKCLCKNNFSSSDDEKSTLQPIYDEAPKTYSFTSPNKHFCFFKTLAQKKEQGKFCDIVLRFKV